VPPFRAYGPLSDLVFGAFAQWDSQWFLAIVEHGYDSQEKTAFFPLYPLVVRGLATVTGSALVAGVLVSLVAGTIGVVLVGRIAEQVLGARVARDAVVLYALYPIAFVFTAVYSDGLFLALAAGCYLAAMRGQPLVAGLLGALATGTRLVGLALVPALLLLLWTERSSSPRQRAGLLAPLLTPAGLLLYAVYLRHRFGDWAVFAHAQRTFWFRHTAHLGPLGGAWQALTSAFHGAAELGRHLPRAQGYPAGLSRPDQYATWNVVHFALLLAALWLTWLVWRRLGAPLAVYSLTLLAITLSAPAEGVPLVSLPRFLLADFPLFIGLACLTVERPRIRLPLLVGFAATGAAAAVAFSHHSWVA